MLAAIAAGIFVYKKYFVKKSELINHLPPETSAYFEFNLKDEKLIDFFAKNFRAKTKFEKLIKQTEFWGSFDPQIISPLVDTIGLVVLEDKEKPENFSYAWLLSSKQKNSLPAILPADSFAADLDNKILVVASSYEALNIFKKNQALKQDSLNKQIIFSKFSAHKFFNCYFSANYLNFVTQKSQDIAKLILDNFKLDPQSPAYFSLRADEKNIIFNFQAVSGISSSFSKLSSKDFEIFNQLIQNSIFSALETPNLKIYTDLIEEQIKDSLGQQNFEEQKSNFSKKYAFNWQDFYDLVSGRAIIFLKDKDDKIQIKNLFSPQASQAALFIDVKECNKRQFYYYKLKDFLSHYIAFLYPLEKTTKLADGSAVTTIQADKEAISWQTLGNTEFIESNKIKIAIAKNDLGIFLGPDKNFINELLTENNKNDKLNTCPGFSGHEISYFNSSQFISGVLSHIDDIYMIINKKGKGINVKGCLLW